MPMDCRLTLSRDHASPVFLVQTSAREALHIRAPGGDAQPAASPLEVMLSGATACSAYDILHLLQQRGIEVAELTVQARAERASTAPRVFTEIHLHYGIRAPQADLESVRAVIALSVGEHCSALGMLKHTARIDFSLELLP